MNMTAILKDFSVEKKQEVSSGNADTVVCVDVAEARQ